MKHFYIILLFTVCYSFSANAQTIDTLQTRAEYQQFAFHEPGFEIDQNNGTLYYGGTTGIYISSDHGDSWSFKPFLVGGNERAIHHLELNQNSGRLYAASTDGGIGYTDDMGDTWEILNTSSAKGLYIDDDNICYANVGALFRWEDGDWGNRVNLLIQADKVTPGDGGYLYAVSENQDKIYFSSDNGISWEVGVDADDEAKFILPKANNEVIYSIWGDGLFTAPYDFSSEGTSIGGTVLDGIKTEDGFMWMIINNNQWIFSEDNGENLNSTYGAITTELLNGVDEPSIDADGIRDQLDTYEGVIYLAETKGRIYTVQSGTVGITEQNHSDIKTYPNPIHQGENLKISSAHPPEKISVYDLSGKLITSLFNSTILPTEQLNLGVYIIQIQAGSELITTKLVVD